MELHQIILQLIFNAGIINADRIVDATGFEVDLQTCVSEDGRKTQSQISSLTVCASLCMTDQTCRAVTYISKTNMCHLSTDNDLHNCTLQKGDGTVNDINYRAPCPEGLEICNRDAQVYYEFVDTGNTYGSLIFNDASTACQNSGGQLAVLDTDSKIQWINEFRESQVSNNFIRGQRFWIGLTLQDGVGTWVNGETLTDSDWDSDRPGGSGSTCVETWDSGRQWQWTDEGCMNTKHYICEYSF